MSNSDVQYFMQALADLHDKFSQKDYKLTPLDQNSATNLVEQLYAKLITTPAQPVEIESKVLPQPVINEPIASTQKATIAPPRSDSDSDKEEINKELDQVFSPSQNVESTPVPHPKNESFSLGLNEKIMFAKELFNDNATTLSETIRKLRSFENADSAYDFFDKQLTPYLASEGKDEEVIHDFRSIISRIYS